MGLLNLPSRKLPKAEETPTLLKIAEAAKECRVTYRTMWTWVHTGQIDYVQWGKTIRIPREALHGKAARQSRGHDLQEEGRPVG